MGKWIKRTSENCEGIGRGWIRGYGEQGELSGAKGKGDWQRIGGYSEQGEVGGTNREKWGKRERRLAENRGNSEQGEVGQREGRLAENRGYSEQGEVGQKRREIGREWGIQ